MSEEIFKQEAEKLGIIPTKKQMQQLDIFYQFLIETNEKMNLTRITDKKDVYLKHFYDSLTIVKIYDLNQANTLLDIGSGAGFPGVILKIFFPHLEITLIDALQKRVNYLNQLINKLELSKIKAYHIRAEDLARKNQTFDIVTARAVASLSKLLDYTMPLVNSQGYFIAMKANIEEELLNVRPILTKKNYIIKNRISFLLPIEKSTRNLLLISK